VTERIAALPLLAMEDRIAAGKSDRCISDRGSSGQGRSILRAPAIAAR
jgi:hypothetical protein